MDQNWVLFPWGLDTFPSITSQGQTPIHSHLKGDPAPTWEVGKLPSSLPLCCLEERANCSSEPIARVRGTSHSRVGQTSLPSAWTIAQWSSHLQRAAGPGRGPKILLGHLLCQALKTLTWVWGTNAIGEVEAHPFSRIQIPFKDTCPTSSNHIRAALV